MPPIASILSAYKPVVGPLLDLNTARNVHGFNGRYKGIPLGVNVFGAGHKGNRHIGDVGIDVIVKHIIFVVFIAGQISVILLAVIPVAVPDVRCRSLCLSIINAVVIAGIQRIGGTPVDIDGNAIFLIPFSNASFIELK